MRRLALVAGVAVAIMASLAAPGFAQTGGLAAQSARISMLRSAGKYSEALPLAQAMVDALEKTSNNRDLAAALNNLAQIYADQGHDDQAEPIYKRAIALMEKGTGLDSVEIAPVLSNLAALDQRQGRFADGGRSIISPASAVNKLAVRLAAGSDRFAELVRKDQDLAAESESLDKAIIAAVSKPSAQRDVASEQRSRARIAAVTSERAGLQKTLAIEFPD